MLSLLAMRQVVKQYFDKIRNEKFRQMLLQALPFWIASLVTGVIAVGYARLFALAEQSATRIFQLAHWSVFIVTPVCFIAAVWLVRRFAPFAKGSGIPQVMAALETISPAKEPGFADRLLNLRITFVKIVSSCLMAVGSGVVGREGPTIQIAGSVFRKINAWLPEWWPKISKRNMIMTGAAAGLAAAFNTPLGGVVFAMEELAKDHIRMYRTAVFSAVIIAGLTAQGLIGPYLYIGYPDIRLTTGWIILPVIVVSIIAGAFAAVLCRWMLQLIRWKNGFRKEWKVWGYVLLCGLVIAALAFFTDQRAVLSGKEGITASLFTDIKTVPWYMPLLRAAGSLFSFTTGAAGGVFAPALSTGASAGAVVAHWFSLGGADTNLVILTGMVAFLTGVTRSPFTSAILVLEMTDGHNVIFYLMLGAMVAGMAAYFIDRHSLYDRLKKEYLHELSATAPK